MADERKQKKKARVDGEGSIYQRGDDQWTGSISLGYDADGKRLRRTVYGKSRPEVVRKLNELKQGLAMGQPVKITQITVAQHFYDWLKQKKLNVRLSTWCRDESYTRNHIIPYLGHIKINKLSHRDIISFYLYLQEETELAPRTIYDIATILKAGLKDATNKNLITRNPAELIQKPPKGTKEARCLDQEEIQRFIKEAEGTRLEELYILMLHTGLRPGEALGLSWDRIDFDVNRIIINQALHEVSGKLHMGEVKTNSGRRTIAISESVAQALKNRKKKQLEEKLATGAKWDNKHNLVFTSPTGKPLSRTSVLKYDLKKILKKANIEGVTLHTFRHTHASILIYQGADIKTISRRLGHADITTTLQIYGHLLPGQDERAAKLMDDFTSKIK